MLEVELFKGGSKGQVEGGRSQVYAKCGSEVEEGLIAKIVTKAEGNHLLSQSQRLVNFGSGSTVFLPDSVCTRGLEYTLAHTSTKVSTSAKLAARKVRGGRVRGMSVLVVDYMYSLFQKTSP